MPRFENPPYYITAYGLAVKRGYKGTLDEWLASLKGTPGEAATLVSSVVEYLVSDSGTVIPSGSWTTTIPTVAQGKYLWTRTTQTYNTGDPIISYSVSRMGVDGLGSVASVCSVSPDPYGNVQLTASDVGALSAVTTAVTLPSSGWSDNQQQVDVDGVTADPLASDVVVYPTDNSYDAYAASAVRACTQLDGAVVFRCRTPPSVDLIVNIAVRK